MSIRILIVEDYEPFRRFVCSALGKRAELQVIGEVSDGPEAVEKAEELKPDVILLDIRLPTLDGIEVARRIHELAPESKIIFLSMEYSIDVVQEALSLGALGYIEKLSSAAEILSAVEAVCRGNPYVSLSHLPPQRRTCVGP
jgi:DNA-binding NarL/FixJ family response regulator